MARQKSGFLSALGIMWQVWKALIDKVLNLGGTDEDLRRIETDSGLRRKIAELLKVTVDYSRSLAGMIAAGKYGHHINPNITEEHFSVHRPPVGFPTKVEVNLELVHFNKVMTGNEVLAEFNKRGLEPAFIEHLLAVGEQFPDLQLQFRIVAPGSVWRHWDGDRVVVVPYLLRWLGERGLLLDWFEGGWGGTCRFLAVRKS